MSRIVKRVANPGNGDHVLALSHMLSNRIGKAFASDLPKYDLTVAEWRVMLTLAAHGQASGDEITNRWAIDKMAVNRAVASLVRRQLVSKKQCSQDRRIVHLSLTLSGNALYDRVLPVANNRYRELLTCLDKTEIMQLHQALTKMIAHADAITD